MAKKVELKEGTDFTALTSDLSRRTSKLCTETYGATKKPLPEKDTKELIARAEAFMAEFEELRAAYSGGRRESIENAGRQVEALKEFTDTLKKQVGKR
jgi:hypothetical protein